MLTAGLVVATVTPLQARASDLDRREERLGPMTTVAVAVGDHDAGELLTPDDTELRSVPASMAPADALRSRPERRRLVTPIGDREVVTRRRLVDGRPSELAAKVPSGWRAVAVPLPPAALHLEPDDHVDLVALTGPGTSEVIVSDGLVLTTADGSATVAVPADDVGAVADAVLAATLTVALVGPR